ncbi:MAG: FAD:protein FMN transferase, partial [Acidimicrobiales bacterium]
MTATLDVREGFVVATTPAITSHARVVLRTDPTEGVDGCDPALAVFHDVHAACSRFDPESELHHCNARAGDWHFVSGTCLSALREAWWAYRRSGGGFDPRLPAASASGGVRLPWRPRFADAAPSVHLGGDPVDLDG